MIDNNELKSHCAQYILPVGLVYGQVMIDDILHDRLSHPEVARLSAVTRLVGDPELDRGYPERYASIVQVTATDGRQLTRQVEHAKGTMENPLTAEEIYQKYRQLATTVTSPAHAGKIADLVHRIDRLPDLAGLAAMLRTLKGTGPGRTARTRNERTHSRRRRREL
jgi:2-methylcitrate dehydratase PrpD